MRNSSQRELRHKSRYCMAYTSLPGKRQPCRTQIRIGGTSRSEPGARSGLEHNRHTQTGFGQTGPQGKTGSRCGLRLTACPRGRPCTLWSPFGWRNLQRRYVIKREEQREARFGGASDEESKTNKQTHDNKRQQQQQLAPREREMKKNMKLCHDLHLGGVLLSD